MLPTYIIGLREGLEAALIVGIVAAFLAQQNRRDALRQVWIGTGAAVALCIAIGVALNVLSRELPQRQQEALETVIGLIAVVIVTYMVFWMRSHARSMSSELKEHAASALATGSARALVVMAFLAVMREGFETAVFLLATFQHSTNPLAGGVGALLGILCAVVVGWLIFKGGLKINLGRFFLGTGVVLVVIAAGLVMSSFRTAHEAGWITFGQSQPLDLTWLVRPGTPLSSLVTGVLGIQQKPALVEIIAYVAFLVPMLVILFLPSRRRPTTAAATEPAATEPAATTTATTATSTGPAATEPTAGEPTPEIAGTTGPTGAATAPGEPDHTLTTRPTPVPRSTA